MAASTDDRSGGEASGYGAPAVPVIEEFLVQLLRRPPTPQPPAPPAQPSSSYFRPPDTGAAGSSFRFLPHSLITPPDPPAPPPPPPQLSDVLPVLVPPTHFRVPIPRGLPPGPWLPEEMSPSVADPQRSESAGRQPGHSGDQNAWLLYRNTKRNPRFEQRKRGSNGNKSWFYSSKMTNFEREERNVFNGQVAYWKVKPGDGYKKDRIRNGSNGNGHYPAEYDHMRDIHSSHHQVKIQGNYLRDRNMHQMRPHYEGFHRTYSHHPQHYMSQQFQVIEQKRLPHMVQKPRIKQEWVPVRRSLDGKHTSQVENHVLQDGLSGDGGNQGDDYIEHKIDNHVNQKESDGLIMSIHSCHSQHSMSQKLQAIEQKRLTHVVQKSKVKHEWVPVRSLDGKHTLEVENHVLQGELSNNGNQGGDHVELKMNNHVDLKDCFADSNGLIMSIYSHHSRHSISQSLQTTEQKRVPHVLQKSRIKQEWVPVRRELDQKHTVEAESQVLQDELSINGGNQGDGSVDSHLDKTECAANNDWLIVERSHVEESFDDLQHDCVEEGNPFEAINRNQEEIKDIAVELGSRIEGVALAELSITSVSLMLTSDCADKNGMVDCRP